MSLHPSQVRTLNIEKRVEETKRLIEAMRAELWRRRGEVQ